jgi:uncharacterized membrane protein
MNRLDRFFAGLLWLLGTLFVAGSVHIVAIFALPDFEEKAAFTRVSALGKPAQLTLLARLGPGVGFAPFSDPAMAQGVCLFDLSQGPLRVHGDVDADRMITLSFRTPAGRIFYSMSDRAAQHGKIDVLVLSAEQLESLEAEDDEEDDAVQALRLVAPTQRGVVLINSLAVLPSEWPEAEQRVKALSCDTEHAASQD